MGAVVAVVSAIAKVATAASAVKGLFSKPKQPALPPPPPPPEPVEAPTVADPKAGVIEKPKNVQAEQSAKIRTLKRRQAATRRGKLASQQDGRSGLLGG